MPHNNWSCFVIFMAGELAGFSSSVTISVLLRLCCGRIFLLRDGQVGPLTLNCGKALKAGSRVPQY